MKSNRFIKRLDWYIIKKFLGTYVFAIALIISIAVVFDFNEKMDKLMEHEAPWDKIIFEYYMNFIPYFSNLFSPLFVFIAVIFFTSKLAENSEIIAMFSTGMSFKRMMRPYMISAAIIALTTFTLSSYVIPKGSVTRLNFEDRYIKPKKQNSVSNVQLEVDSGVIAYIDNYNNAMKTGNRFSLDKFVDKKMVSHLTARRITYDTTTVHKWTIHDYMIRELDGLKEKITKGDRIDSIINMEPSDFLIMKNQQEMLTSPQLSDYIAKQKRRGFANIKEFEIEYFHPYHHRCIAFIPENKRWYGAPLGYRIRIKFFLYPIPNDYFHLCCKRKCASCHCSLDSQYPLCRYRILPVSESTQITRKQQIKGLQAFRSLQELDPQTVPRFRIYRRKKDIKIRSSAYSC